MVKVGLNNPLNHNKKTAMTLAQIAFSWIDLLWVPAALLAVERGKRFLAVGFVLACVFLLRLQVELFQQLGFARGFMGFMDSAIFPRGLVTYGVFIALFLLIAFYSKGSHKSIFMAASITILIAAFCVSCFIMVL